MKASVMIIAHNEEKYIRRCLTSVTNQTRKPDEVVLIAHNCTDKTESIAQEFPTVRVVSYKGPAGVTYSRKKGFEESKGDIIICTDGDSFVMRNWIASMISPFENNSDIVGVGSPVIYYGLWLKVFFDIGFIFVSLVVNKIFRLTLKNRVTPYFWGPSMAIRKDAYFKVGGLNEFETIRKSLGLKWWPDDTYLAILLSKIGKIHITHRTLVFAKAKDKSSVECLKKMREQKEDGDKMFNQLIKS